LKDLSFEPNKINYSHGFVIFSTIKTKLACLFLLSLVLFLGTDLLYWCYKTIMQSHKARNKNKRM